MRLPGALRYGTPFLKRRLSHKNKAIEMSLVVLNLYLKIKYKENDC